MSKLTEIETYFTNIAVLNKRMLHGEPTHRSFITVQDEEALSAAVATGISFPCVAYEDASGRLINKKDSIRKRWQHTLYFLHKESGENEQTAKKLAYTTAELLMNEWISRLIHDSEQDCSPFKTLEPESFSWQMTGDVIDGCYGFKLQFGDESSAKDITIYDASKWDN